MLTEQLYNKAKAFSLKSMKGNTFLAEEALHMALAGCAKTSNWYKPFVMQCVANACKEIYIRGYNRRVSDSKIEKNKLFYLIDDTMVNAVEYMSNEDVYLMEHSRSIEDLMHFEFVLKKVYPFLTARQKKVYKALRDEDSYIDGAKSINMNYETFKINARCVLSVFEYYVKYDKLPETQNPYIDKYYKRKLK